MKPRYLVYILSAIILAFVIKGYFYVDEIQHNLWAIQQGVAIDHGTLCYSLEDFKKHLVLSGVLSVVIAVCCKLKGPK